MITDTDADTTTTKSQSVWLVFGPRTHVSRRAEGAPDHTEGPVNKL